MQKKIKIGILGGSFDPIHLGHLLLSTHLVSQKLVDKIILVPAFHAPHKNQDHYQAHSYQRLEMIHRSIRDVGWLEVSSLEIEKKRPVFTFETLQELSMIDPNANLYLIIGQDNFNIFHTWKNYQDILKQFKVIVYQRPGYSQINNQNLYKNEAFIFTDLPIFDISSTQIKKWIKNKKPYQWLVPGQVYQYIEENHLYQDV